MIVLKVALGVVQSRGHKVISPGLVALGPEEADFLPRHVQKVRVLTDATVRSVFRQGSGIGLLAAAIGIQAVYCCGVPSIGWIGFRTGEQGDRVDPLTRSTRRLADRSSRDTPPTDAPPSWPQMLSHRVSAWAW